MVFVRIMVFTIILLFIPIMVFICAGSSGSQKCIEQLSCFWPDMTNRIKAVFFLEFFYRFFGESAVITGDEAKWVYARVLGKQLLENFNLIPLRS